MHHNVIKLEEQVAQLQAEITAHNTAISEAIAEAVGTGILDVAKYADAKRGLDGCMLAVSGCNAAMSSLHCRCARAVQ